ncbi:hypothetical protein D3C84_648700 [compost metagenome]
MFAENVSMNCRRHDAQPLGEQRSQSPGVKGGAGADHALARAAQAVKNDTGQYIAGVGCDYVNRIRGQWRSAIHNVRGDGRIGSGQIQTGLPWLQTDTGREHDDVRIACVLVITRIVAIVSPECCCVGEVQRLPFGPYPRDIDDNDLGARNGHGRKQGRRPTHQSCADNYDLGLPHSMLSVIP